MGRHPKPKYATCHPDKLNESKGLCKNCYIKSITTPEKRNLFNKLRRERRQAYRMEHPIEPRQKKTPWYERNKEKVSKKARERNLAFYGLTTLDYDMMFQEQDGVCAICGRPPKNTALNVDHEHQRQEKKKSPESRKVRIRGLLCHRCNRALGLFGNDLELLLFASKNFAEYIEKYYAKRLVDRVGIDEAKRIMGNTVTYLEKFEKKLQDNK